MNDYKFDIAISLCKQDVDFARKLVKALNPGLKVFFYEYRQEELITKSGPEAFAKIFKEESRIAVILSRDEWSETPYTEIEKNAIVDRTFVKNQGYNFLVVLPMEPGQIPLWYPSTKIYADPRRFSIEDLARFIEFKVADSGGLIKPITSEEFASHFIEKLKEKKKIVGLQSSMPAIETLKSEIESLKRTFNKKADYFSQNNYSFSLNRNVFSSGNHHGLFGINGYLLSCEIQNIEGGIHLRTTQQVTMIIKIIEKNPGGRFSDLTKPEEYKFYYSEHLWGWSIPLIYSGGDYSHFAHLFSDIYQTVWYDLKDPIRTDDLVDLWFTKLWMHVKEGFSKIL